MTADPLFYEIFKELPELFFELIGLHGKEPSIYKFSAPDFKQKGFRLDGLLLTKEGYNYKEIYFLEAQSYKDKHFYDKFFGKIILYLTQYHPPNKDWYAVVIYDKHSNEGKFPPYLNLLLPTLRCFYLDELAKAPNPSLPVGIMRLVVEKKKQDKTTELARQLINQASQELTDATLKEKVLEFIKTVVIDKFANLSREELEVMLNLESLKKSKVYQEGKEEGREEGALETKLQMVPKLIKLGLSIEQVAESLELDMETIKKVANQ
ncbi:MAG: Rpn family recombination-promoting nuclease/putative transposase [Scytonematopsis contorta HA4267-MV1]|jgi:predicted transposase/invertase (TIGR01784 family)|nr:Rpn family recombination-promoting nuclease/putative transposase [Scytonematopsis contorta HA4267-MV1]